MNEDEVATDEDESPTTPARPRQRTTRRELVEDPVLSSVVEEEDFVTSPRAPSYRVVPGSVRRRILEDHPEEEDFVTSPRAPSYRVVPGSVRRRNLEDHPISPVVEEEDSATNFRARVPSYRTVSTEKIHLTYRN